MRTPCEWTLNDFVPKIRRNLVKQLYVKGSNQSEIAKILGISQPRVSQYLKGEKQVIRKMAPEQSQLIETQMGEIVERTVNDIIKALDQGKQAPETIPIICYSCRELRMGNALCSLHRYDYPELDSAVGHDKNCDLCLKWKTSPESDKDSVESLGSRFNTLKTLETISNILIMKPTFPDFIPQIGAQLCSIFESTEKEQDSLQNVAGFPGRIIQIQGRAKIVSRPEFNSSKTTGQMLLDIRTFNKALTSVLSIKTSEDKEFLDNLIKKKFLVLNTTAIDMKGLIKTFEEKASDILNKVAVIDSGSVGYEPITYLFVSDITDLIELFN